MTMQPQKHPFLAGRGSSKVGRGMLFIVLLLLAPKGEGQ